MEQINNLTKIIGRWTITAEFECIDDGESIAAANSISSIKPLMLPDGTYDKLAVNEYEDFVINLLGVFDRCDFEVIEERKSPYSFSYYFDLVKKDQANKKDYKYILFVRVSDHELTEQKKSNQKDWLNDRAESLKQPETKSKQVWRLKRLLVNKDTYFSYEEALEDIEGRLS